MKKPISLFTDKPDNFNVFVDEKISNSGFLIHQYTFSKNQIIKAHCFPIFLLFKTIDSLFSRLSLS